MQDDMAMTVSDPALPPLQVNVEVARALKKKLSAKTPKQYIKSRPGPMKGGERIWFKYVPWGYVCRVLNDAFGPAWSYTYDPNAIQRIPLPPLPEKKASGRDPGRPAVPREEVMVTVTLTTPFGKQTATASHTYYPGNAEILYGDVVQSAVSKALRRAGSRLGIGLDLNLSDDADEFETATTLNLDGDRFKSACTETGIPLRGAIALLSNDITGDPEALDNVGDIIEALGSVEAAIVRLNALALEVADADVVDGEATVIEDDEPPAPPPAPRAPRRKS